MSSEILSRIAGWCLADPKLNYLEDGPAVEVAGDPPLRLNLAVTGEEVLLSHHLTLTGAAEGALAQAAALVNRRGSLLRGTAAPENGGLGVDIEYPIYLDGLTRQNFLLATQELAATADAVAGLGTVAAAAAPQPKVMMEPAVAAPAVVAPMVTETAAMPAPAPQVAAAFMPTHEVPAGGMSAWANPDPSLQPIARLEARVQLRVDERRGAWARVTGSNGWTGWVDDRRLSPLGGAPAMPVAAAPVMAAPVVAAPVMAHATAPMPVTAAPAPVWQATHQVPSGGMPAWATPDPSTTPIELAGRVQLAIAETRGDWARVTGSNGWTGWVDARRLEPLGRAAGTRAGFALRPLPLVGGIALIVATFLAWSKGLAIGSVGLSWESANGWDWPLGFLWNMNNWGNQPRIGLVVLIIGIVGLGAAFIPRMGRALAAFAGVLGAVVGALYVVQLIRFFGQDGVNASAGDVLGNALGIGPWIALGGALLLLIGALIPDRRS